MELKKLMEHISIIPDYRQAWNVEHKLSDILLLTICAVISGAEGWEDIEGFGETHLDFLKQYGDFENGMPVHDTIARVVSCISPAKFHECFINWMRDCHSSNDKDVIAIDGKALPHSYDKSGRRRAGFRSHTPTLPGPKHSPHSPQPKLIRISPCRKLIAIFP